MKLLIVDNGSQYLDYLKQLVKIHETVIKKYSTITDSDINEYDLTILSGGHTIPVIGHEQEFAQELKLIKQSAKPILGICLGFELIAHAFDATLKKLSTKEHIILNIKPLASDSIFSNLSNLEVYESHRWVVSKSGNKLLALASSKDGIEIIKHPIHLIYGFQFHPEMFIDVTQGDELFANFIKIVQNSPV